MMTCMESYACICENLECNPSQKAKEALDVIREFRDVFESADAAMQNPILQEICRTLPKLHFEGIYPLDTKPVETIRREYKKRTGDNLNAYFCTIAYRNTLKADKEKSRGADTDKARRGQKSGILDADTEQRKSLLHQLKEKAEKKTEENREEKTTSSSGGN